MKCPTCEGQCGSWGGPCHDCLGTGSIEEMNDLAKMRKERDELYDRVMQLEPIVARWRIEAGRLRQALEADEARIAAEREHQKIGSVHTFEAHQKAIERSARLRAEALDHEYGVEPSSNKQDVIKESDVYAGIFAAYQKIGQDVERVD